MLEELSIETRQAILTAEKIDSDNKIVRSIQLDVFFSNDDLLMVKPRTEGQNEGRVVYEAKKDNVQAVTWCD